MASKHDQQNSYAMKEYNDQISTDCTCQLLKPLFFVFFLRSTGLNSSIVDRVAAHAGRSSAAHSSVRLDEKYEGIRSEAIRAGVLLKETDEKIDNIIHDGRQIESHAHDVRANAARFYRNLMQSEKIIRYCQWMFVTMVIAFVLVIIGKKLTRTGNG